MHDRYFQDGIGGQSWWGKVDPLKAEWLIETPWRVSVLNPTQQYFLEQYVMPLRFGDVLGYTKGGFSIGTAGVETELAQFSRAFRALPAIRFADVKDSTETIPVRALKSGKFLWFYAVNTGREAVSLSFAFNCAPGIVTDLAAQRAQTVAGTQFAIRLNPCELRSFRVDSADAILKVSLNGHKVFVDHPKG